MSLLSSLYGFSSSHGLMWELDHKEGWAQKSWCFQIVVLEIFRVPWTTRRSNQSILKEIDPECSLEGLMLTLKLQYTLAIWWEELTHWKSTWSWDRLRARGEWSSSRWKHYIASLTQWTRFWGNSGREWRMGKPGHASVHGVAKCHTWLSDWMMNTRENLRHGSNLSVWCLLCEDTHTHTHTHTRVLLNHRKEWNNVICSNMNGLRG